MVEPTVVIGPTVPDPPTVESVAVIGLLGCDPSTKKHPLAVYRGGSREQWAATVERDRAGSQPILDEVPRSTDRRGIVEGKIRVAAKVQRGSGLDRIGLVIHAAALEVESAGLNVDGAPVDVEDDRGGDLEYARVGGLDEAALVVEHGSGPTRCSMKPWVWTRKVPKLLKMAPSPIWRPMPSAWPPVNVAVWPAGLIRVRPSRREVPFMRIPPLAVTSPEREMLPPLRVVSPLIVMSAVLIRLCCS